MKRQTRLASVLSITLGMAGGLATGVLGASSDACAQTSSNNDGLAPVVMIVFDTSGSMDNCMQKDKNDNCIHTRLTKAVAEITGTPKGTPALVEYTGQFRPRKYWKCDTTTNNCSFEYKKYTVKYSNYPKKGKSTTFTNVNYTRQTTYRISKLGYNDQSPSNGDEFDKYYNKNGVLNAYQYAIKFGFGSMCSYGYDSSGNYTENSSSKAYNYGKYDFGDAVKGEWGNLSTVYGARGATPQKRGICNANTGGPAPLMYPTVSNNINEIYDQNAAIISTIRSFSMFSGTPIYGVLQQVKALMIGDSETNMTPDYGMIKQPFAENGKIVIKEDEQYACRNKALILMTDGEPAQADYDVNAAYQLYKNGVKVYAIGYAASFTPGNLGANALNQIAWKGGTCYDPDTREWISPDISDSAFQAKMGTRADGKKGTIKGVTGRKCFHDASNATALRHALVSAFSDMLKSFQSKTRIATSTAISRKYNYKDGFFNNGFYNVYSGFNITAGQIRTTILERETQVCDRRTEAEVASDGQNRANIGFSADPDQFMDFAARLKCKVNGCVDYYFDETTQKTKKTDLSKRAGYLKKNPDGSTTNTRPAPCATKFDSSYSALISYQTYDQLGNMKNTCSEARNIFTGNYKSGGRFAIRPEPVSIYTKDDDEVIAGYIPDGGGAGIPYHYLIRDERNPSACINNMKAEITDSSFVDDPNYILSPYECVNALDCPILGDQDPLECDLGRCVAPEGYNNESNYCESTVSKDELETTSTDLCVNLHKRWPFKNSDHCKSHNECIGQCSGLTSNKDGGCVCHAGNCVPGVVKSCDVRQFIASQPLGTIEYASPTVLEPPNRNYRSGTYQTFKNNYWTRDNILFVGANDGMLHAFILGDNDFAKYHRTGNTYELSDNIVPDPDHKLEFSDGDELWGFIPKTVLPNVTDLVNYGPQRHINSTPIVKDVLAPNDATTSNAHGAWPRDGWWHSVIVGGFGNGGRGYYALDVTNPGQPKILWEIDHQWQPWDTPAYPDMNDIVEDMIDVSVSLEDDLNNRNDLESESGYPFQLLGQSLVEPLIANVNIHGKIEPVAIITAGVGSSNTNDRIGRAVYIVKLFPETKKDLLVKAFYFKNKVTGTPEAYPNNFNAIAQFIYFGDETGSLFRLNISSSDPDDWGADHKITISDPTSGKSTLVEAPIFVPNEMDGLGSEDYNAITFKPAVSLYSKDANSFIVQLAFGTGGQEDLAVGSNERNYIANFYDRCVSSGTMYTCQLNDSDSTAYASQINVFNPASGVTNTTKTVNGTYGKQKYTIKAITETANKLQKMTGPAITYNFYSYYPTYVIENSTCALGHAGIWRMHAASNRHSTLSTEHIQSYNTDASTLFNDANNRHYALNSTSKLYGFQITNQMVCLDKNGNLNKIITPQLIAQTGINTNFNASTQTKDSNLTIPSLALDLDPIEPTSQIVSWASVYE